MKNLESQYLDFKQSWQDDHLKTLCAFANTEGGTIQLGKDDQGCIVALENPKKLLESLPGKIIQKLGVYPKVDLVYEDTKPFISIIVEASPLPVGLNGKYYRRVGSTNQELKGPALSQFLMEKSGNGWDDLPDPQASIQDLIPDTMERFQRLAAERIPSIRMEPLKAEKDFLSFLQKLDLAEGDMLHRSAVLLFGKSPQRFYREISSTR